MCIARRAIGLLFLVLFGIENANAQRADFASLAELNSMRARMAEYERQLNTLEISKAESKSGCYACDTTAGLTAGVELLFLKPFQSEGEAPGFDYQATYRAWLGATAANGIGLRTRWFEYHAHNPANVGVSPFIEDIDMSVFDVEVTDKFELGHWKGLLSGGVRFAEYKEFGFTDADEMNDSIGPVLGVELERPVNDRLSLFGLVRGSLQFADSGLDNGTPMDAMTFSVAETQLGAQWTIGDLPGGRFFARGAFEAQYWSGGVVGDGDTEDLGLVGGTLSLGITR